MLELIADAAFVLGTIGLCIVALVAFLHSFGHDVWGEKE